MQNVTTGLYHDTLHGEKKNGFPVKIRITYLRERHYYRTGIDLTKKEWLQVFSPNPPKKYKDIRAELALIEERAQKIISELPFFSFDAFIQRFFSKQSGDTLSSLLEQYAHELKKQKRFGNAASVNNTLASLNAFRKNIYLNEISPALFREYEQWMLDNGKSLTTIGIYIRAMRTVINDAINKGIMKAEQYPFGKRKYIIPTGSGTKRAIPKMETQKLEKFKAPTKGQQRAVDYFLFSYYAFGINMTDILQLRNKDIQDGFIIKERQKTRNTLRSNPKPLIIPVTPKMQKIIQRQGSGDKRPDDYVFPVLKGMHDPEAIHKTCRNFISGIDKLLKKIGKRLNIKVSLSTYVARHSFATRLIQAGYSKSHVGTMLGHGSEKTTENYFGGLEKDYLKKVAKEL